MIFRYKFQFSFVTQQNSCFFIPFKNARPIKVSETQNNWCTTYYSMMLFGKWKPLSYQSTHGNRRECFQPTSIENNKVLHKVFPVPYSLSPRLSLKLDSITESISGAARLLSVKRRVLHSNCCLLSAHNREELARVGIINNPLNTAQYGPNSVRFSKESHYT